MPSSNPQDDFGLDEEEYTSPHEQKHSFMMELAKYPPLTKKKVRRRYRDLIKEWRHDTALHKYKDLIDEAIKYKNLSDSEPDNAHIYYFTHNKNAKPDDYLT